MKMQPDIPSTSHSLIEPFNELLLGSLLFFFISIVWPVGVRVAATATVANCLSYVSYAHVLCYTNIANIILQFVQISESSGHVVLELIGFVPIRLLYLYRLSVITKSTNFY